MGLAEGMGGRERASGQEGEASIDEWQSGFWWESLHPCDGRRDRAKGQKKSGQCARFVAGLCQPSRTPPLSFPHSPEMRFGPFTMQSLRPGRQGGCSIPRPTPQLALAGRWGSNPARLEVPVAKARNDCAKRCPKHTVTQRQPARVGEAAGVSGRVHPSLPGFG